MNTASSKACNKRPLRPLKSVEGCVNVRTKRAGVMQIDL